MPAREGLWRRPRLQARDAIPGASLPEKHETLRHDEEEVMLMGQKCLDCGEEIVHDNRVTLLCLDCVVIRLLEAGVIPPYINGKKVDIRDNRRPADGPLQPSSFEVAKESGPSGCPNCMESVASISKNPGGKWECGHCGYVFDSWPEGGS